MNKRYIKYMVTMIPLIIPVIIFAIVAGIGEHFDRWGQGLCEWHEEKFGPGY